MKLLILLFTVWLSIASPAHAQRNITVDKSGALEKRVALVIGNAAYKDAPLKNPVNDAKDMAATLRRLGFDVIEKTNVSQKDINRAIAQFGEKLRSDTVALFFYAGHGMQVKGKNYIIPIDAHITGEATVRAEAVDVDTVMDQLAVSPMNIVILDACRNNPFERKFRSTGGGLAQMDAPKGSLIAYATAPGKTAADGDSRNGLYTQELLKHIQTPGLPLEAVFKRVRNGVMAASGDAQTPWESSSLTGDFFFRPAKVGTLPTAPASAMPANTEAVDLAFWESIKNSSDSEDFQSYLNRFPNGQFVELAERRVKKRQATTLATKPLASDTTYWESSDGSSFTLRLDGNKVLLTRTKGGDDINVLNVAFSLYPESVSVPMIISGSLEDNRFAGEFRQDGGITNNRNCNVPERKGQIEGIIDLSAGAIRLTYDRTTFRFETEFESIFSDKFVCRVTERKLTQSFVLELAPARTASMQPK